MGYQLKSEAMNALLLNWGKDWLIYAPSIMKGDGMYSDTDIVRYGAIKCLEEVVFDRKSDYSFKEILLPITQRLFYYTEDSIKEADAECKKGAIIFLRSCDMHAVKRLDEIYLKNGYEDHYFKRLRSKVKFVLMGCQESFENCFCVSMQTNESNNYDLALNVRDDVYEIDSKWDDCTAYLEQIETEKIEVTADSASENSVEINIPADLSIDVMKFGMWDEYDGRCINCGRCNFVCPTCTCFTMQDIFYTDNGKAGERRRVHASCMVDGYTDVAGGGSYRMKNGERMRFKVLHKVYDYNKRFGYHMCVGCGRCDDVCPEYISFSNCVNKLGDAVKEVNAL